MIDLLNAIGFGIVGIACIFLVVVWSRVALEKDKQEDLRYKVVAWALCVGSTGLGVLAINRVLRAIYDVPLPDELLFAAALLLIASKVALMSGTAIDGDSKNFLLFTLACASWAMFCVWLFLS